MITPSSSCKLFIKIVGCNRIHNVLLLLNLELGIKHQLDIGYLLNCIQSRQKVVFSSMGVGVQSKAFVAEDVGQLTKLVQDLISRNEIVIFSKTYCPYCKMAKDVFDSLNHKYTVIELDQRADGSAIQTVLGQMTGVKTVPRVFIRGRCVGGGNELKTLFESGLLVTMLK